MAGKRPHPIPGLGSSSEESDNDEVFEPQSPADIVIDRATPDSVAEEVVVTTEDEDDFEPEAEPDQTQETQEDEEEPEYDPMDVPFLIRAQQKRAEEPQAAGPSDLDAAQQLAGSEPAPVVEEEAMEEQGGEEDEEPEYSFAIDRENRKVCVMTGKYSDEEFVTLEKISVETFNMMTERVFSPNVEDDDHFYCEQCVMSFRVFCPRHPLYRILDRAVAEEKKNEESNRKSAVEDRARKTLPAFIKIRTSSIPKAGMGAFTISNIPVGVVFGPYQGILSKEKDDRGYSWEIRSVDAPPVYLDGGDPKYSNWMRYINSPRFDREQNLVAFQYNGSVFYRVIKPIDAEQELLVWYGAQYGASLGVFSTKRSSNRWRSIIKSTDVKNPFIM